MDCLELNLNKEIGDGGGGGGGSGVGGSVGKNANKSGGGEGFIDRSKVRILLCDNDTKSSEEVLTLLLKCSYQDVLSQVNGELLVLMGSGSMGCLEEERSALLDVKAVVNCPSRSSLPSYRGVAWRRRWR